MSPVLESTARALLRRVALEQSQGRLPSLTAAVVRDGEPAWFGARGRVEGAAPTLLTQYRIGSITKSLVAVVVMRLRDEGKVELLDPVAKHVPGLGGGVGEVTVAQLLSHTSGLSAESPGQWWERTPACRPRIWSPRSDPTPPSTVRGAATTTPTWASPCWASWWPAGAA